MQANFFATTDDWRSLWGWLIAVPGMRVFEHYSRPDQPNREFETVQEIDNSFQQDRSIAAWPSTAGGTPRVERIDFTPNAVRQLGAQGRWALQSPAMITFVQHNEQKSGCLSPAYFSCWSEAGVRERGAYSDDFIAEVDWKGFQSSARRLQRHIRSTSSAALGAAPIMPDAMRKLESGEIKLWGWGEEVDAASPYLVPTQK